MPRRQSRHICPVSILVLVDVSLEESPIKAAVKEVPVSILVLVDVSLEEAVSSGKYANSVVSILVLVDVSLEEGGVIMGMECPIWFQSLFSWMFRSKTTPTQGFIALARFQSLFSWMFRSKLAAANGTWSKCRFQSLFSWMFRSKQPLPRYHSNRDVVSILVLVDVSLEVFILEQIGFTGVVSILVLVDVSLEVWAMTFIGSFAGCFNPCSRGCFARSVLICRTS